MTAAIRLHCALHQKMWDGYSATCRQVCGIGKLLAQKLEASGMGSIKQFMNADPRHIERITGKLYPWCAAFWRHFLSHSGMGVLLCRVQGGHKARRCQKAVARQLRLDHRSLGCVPMHSICCRTTFRSARPLHQLHQQVCRSRRGSKGEGHVAPLIIKAWTILLLVCGWKYSR
jgi:hypothetical protein